MRKRANREEALFFILRVVAIIVKNKANILWRDMIEEVEVYLGERKLSPDEIKNYICTNDYVSELVNEVYYKYHSNRKSGR